MANKDFEKKKKNAFRIVSLVKEIHRHLSLNRWSVMRCNVVFYDFFFVYLNNISNKSSTY